MNQLISLLVENKPGALMRVAGVLTARGYNIESLTVARTLDPTLSSMTILVEVDPVMQSLLIKQIKRLVNVVQAVDLTESQAVCREMALIKIDVAPEMRPRFAEGSRYFPGPRRRCLAIVVYARGDRCGRKARRPDLVAA